MRLTIVCACQSSCRSWSGSPGARGGRWPIRLARADCAPGRARRTRSGYVRAGRRLAVIARAADVLQSIGGSPSTTWTRRLAGTVASASRAAPKNRAVLLFPGRASLHRVKRRPLERRLRYVLAADIAIHEVLIPRTAELHDDVVHGGREARVLDERPEQGLDFVSIGMASGNDTTRRPARPGSRKSLPAEPRAACLRLPPTGTARHSAAKEPRHATRRPKDDASEPSPGSPGPCAYLARDNRIQCVPSQASSPRTLRAAPAWGASPSCCPQWLSRTPCPASSCLLDCEPAPLASSLERRTSLLEIDTSCKFCSTFEARGRNGASPDPDRHTGITSIQIPSAPMATPMVWPKRRGDNPSSIRSPTMVPMRTPTVATMMGAQSVSSTGPECQR